MANEISGKRDKIKVKKRESTVRKVRKNKMNKRISTGKKRSYL